jgi:hypothetical protein
VALALGSCSGPRNRVFAVDPHEEFIGVLGGRFGPDDKAAFQANVARAGVAEFITSLETRSVAAARAWKTRDISLLLIDGDHSEDAVRADVAAWLPYVIRSGIIVFHDRSLFGVRRAIEDALEHGRARPVGGADELAWFEVA